MLIGELSRATGVPPRLLRYYEEQGLLVPHRDSNGYRGYPDSAPARVARIRELLAAGLPTRDIRELLPCATDSGLQHCDHSRKVVGDGLNRLDDQIAELTRRRELLAKQRDAVLAAPFDPAP
ncbi:MerR family transcriptional regulator [Nocardia seriolae]|uniref:HTH-type transcriptional regulator HmrR n=1 Tax=Nocardia seriolae TaxID=37332 RepID=A0A0B8NSS3_9NOCA|nr:HTH-type transcriptional regulator HmrR [Nocardia seriolae]GEM28864.1 MerR family transcriptional regulator [Nocardia seriolae NBRC 15557]MTJ60666.1 MerR family transcriptional regulator [Nocardia seriolae]MTJ76447.1 MerR family transcriptional regulator [Nocardia seriolae]MTJ84462.1 MerR family transcriptional regulator [Nocardia seriolae]